MVSKQRKLFGFLATFGDDEKLRALRQKYEGFYGTHVFKRGHCCNDALYLAALSARYNSFFKVGNNPATLVFINTPFLLPTEPPALCLSCKIPD
jgi:hypothetical protein